jgi:hypothetical protein
MAASVSLGSCKQEDVNSNGVTEKRDPNLISVSLDMSAGVQDSIAESEPKHQGRALSYTLEDGEKDGQKSFSILKFDTEKAPETLEAYGIFYCPTAPEGKKVYISNGPMQWKKKNIKNKKVRYEIHKDGIVDIDRSLMDGNHQWYFAAVLGATYDAATKTLSFDPYANARTNGLTYQFNRESINLNLPMTTSWSKLKVREPDPRSTEHWFYPEEYVITQGLPDDVEPSIVFRPRGTVFRMRIVNESINDLKIMSYDMESNAMAFKTTISTDDVVSQTAAATSGDKLQMKPVMSHPARILVYDRGGVEGRVVASKHESKSGVTLAWGYLNEAEQAKFAPNIGKKVSDIQPSPKVPYIGVRVTASPVENDHWNSMEKAADYYPIENRVSYISRMPIFYTYVNQLDKHFKDGGSEWLRVKVATALTNLERTSFEVLAANFTPGNAGSFKRGHPWMNRHQDNGDYWLDQVTYPNRAQLQTWMSDSRPFKGEAKADPDLVDHAGKALVNLVSTAKYYLPHAEEIQSYLPIEEGAGKMDSLSLKAGEVKGPFTVKVIEQDLNIKHGAAASAVHNARFILKGGNSDAVNASNYGKDLKTGADISLVGNIGWDAKKMAPYNYFNYFWCSHIVYGLAYLREGDPESLVAYRYFWGISPENAGTPLRNNFTAEGQWKSGDNERMTALYSPENVAIMQQGTANPNLGETLRKLSAFSAGRAGKGGVGASMISFFSVGMRYIGRQDPLVRSLGDIDVVSDEKWWTSDPKNVVFRIFSAVGFANGKSLPTGADHPDVNNRNRGAYILTQTNSDGAGNHDYFYIGPRSWGRFNTKDEPELSTMWLKMHEGEGKYYRNKTPRYNAYPNVLAEAPHWYKISRAYLPANSGAPTHFMVGTDPKKK